MTYTIERQVYAPGTREHGSWVSAGFEPMTSREDAIDMLGTCSRAMRETAWRTVSSDNGADVYDGPLDVDPLRDLEERWHIEYMEGRRDR